ncbi:DUF5105 domain-containing protein [Companilactobacillus mishanensis]|uniref:DUF4352 domain-containing protein n=1 Tax=Companilactobacillus mishanensis TaxID=2486008 RepID=A0A5P0ZKE6_9LACO|nr:DUF4352 domain-containing protein [Companilactobacillus mishanensis]MQS53544.1 DUF4352 domain-containing protein [Companilactobacillus mishanensis]
MKNRKLNLLLLLVFALVFVVTGCGNNGSSSNNSGDSHGVSMKIGKSQMVVTSDGDQSSKYLAVKVTLKNNSSNELNYSFDDFGLKSDGGNVKSAKSVYFTEDDDAVEKLDFGKISNGESKTGYVFFNTKPGKKYDLIFKNNMYKGTDEIKVNLSNPVDTKVMIDDSKTAEKAAKSYIQAVFFGNDTDDYNRLVSNNLQKERETFNKEANSKILDAAYLSDTVDDDGTDAIVKAYQEASSKKTKIKVRVKELSSKSAVVNISGYVIKLDDVFEGYSGLDEGEQISVEDFASALKAGIDNTKVSKIESDYNDLTLKKDGDKWKIITSGSDFNNITDLFDGTGY